MGKQPQQTFNKQESVEYREGMPVQAQLDPGVDEAQRIDSIRRADDNAANMAKAFQKDDDSVIEAGKEQKVGELDLEQYGSGSTIIPNDASPRRQTDTDSATVEVKKSSRKKLLCILLPLAAVATTAIAALTVAATLPREASQEVVVTPVFDEELIFDEDNDTLRKEYERKITLDLENPVKLADRPTNYASGSKYNSFEYVLPTDFINAGNPSLKSFKSFYDEDNIEGLQFTFTNGIDDITTEIFGQTTDKRGGFVMDKTVVLDEPVTSVQQKMINMSLEPKASAQSTFAMINFGVNSDSLLRVGEEEAMQISPEKASRENLSQLIESNQRIVGVHGLTDKSFGAVRSISFILANKKHIKTEAEYMEEMYALFDKKAAELDADKKLMKGLSMKEKLSLYGLAMQAHYGDNTEPKPKPLMIEKRLLWTAWEEKKGMSSDDAKIAFLEAVDGLW